MIYASTTSEIEKRELDHMDLCRSIAGECVVLLENDGALPLCDKGTIALFGRGARNTVKGGTGSGDVNSRYSINIEQGLISEGFTVISQKWLDRQEDVLKKKRQEYNEWCVEESKKRNVPTVAVLFNTPYREPAPCIISNEDIQLSPADAAVYVITRNSGEGADRKCEKGDYLLFDEEYENLKTIAAAYDKTIVVLNIGGIIDLVKIKSITGINAIVLMGQLGNIGGDSLAGIISGRTDPSGKLTDTWAESYYDYPSSLNFSHNGDVHEEYYTDGIFVGYRYFKSFGVDPEYCFGFGRSYTDFRISDEEVTVEGEEVFVKVTVTNTGNRYPGKEVVQVYYSSPKGEIVKPYQELCGFAKTELLAPGASQTLTIGFSIRDMASYSHERAAWMLESGLYAIRVGNSSAEAKVVAMLRLDATVMTEKCRNLFSLDEPMKEITPVSTAYNDCENDPNCENIAIIPVKNAITTTVNHYCSGREELVNNIVPGKGCTEDRVLTAEDIISGRCSVEELTSQLSVEEMAELCVGTLRAGGGNVVGNASYIIPGAAGDTSSVLEESRGIKKMIMADGPAGLRLQPHFKTDLNGKLIPGGEIFDGVEEQYNISSNERGIDYYQYCTAIPIGWSIAQSWNSELIEKAGEMIGAEMEQFHIDLWLAPAMNIHRNPLCGRNFEYYSEDPFISGIIAAAITKGVQSHKGKGVTIKHFAANNQEENRYFVNAHISERALREIYLKGFEICVRKSRPVSVMTSYNLINGVHTSNRYDLIQSALRDEWGFKGFVMTDWYTSVNVPAVTGKYEAHYPISSSVGCILAGNDVQMPGSQENVDDIIKAVNEKLEIDGYTITRANLQFCAANVIRAALGTEKNVKS